MNCPKASIIISTYNQPEWLQKVLWSYEAQTENDFEILIADDGSTEETKKIVDDFLDSSKLSITHIWQEDKGFQKNKILNKAILKASSGYLIFTDGDCIARKDFVATHLSLRREGVFLSGGYFKLPKEISTEISKETIYNQSCFALKWLMELGLKKTFKTSKLSANEKKSWFLNTFTTTKATFDGMNVSGFRDEILKVNGFDERMQYGGEDRELGERLMNNGIKFKQIRYSAICLHLFHERTYVNSEMIERNKAIRSETKVNRATWTDFGLKPTSLTQS